NLNPTPASVIAARMLYSVDVFIDTFFTEDGKLVPVLKIEWKVATDASIIYLRGAELAVVQLSNNQQICAQFDFQNNLTFQWNFSFNRFEVQPGQMYQVTVYHLPKLSTPGDYNRRSKPFTVPICKVVFDLRGHGQLNITRFGGTCDGLVLRQDFPQTLPSSHYNIPSFHLSLIILHSSSFPSSLIFPSLLSSHLPFFFFVLLLSLSPFCPFLYAQMQKGKHFSFCFVFSLFW
uniref:Interleukin 17 receptor A n=1 Tax=Pseudonaja textilis TaxID=8673 RepID=A0A670Y3M6_PSETE